MSARPSRSKRISRRERPGGKGNGTVMQGCSIPMRLQRRLKPVGRSSRRSKQASIVESPRFWYNSARGGDMSGEESDKVLVERLKAGDAIAFGTLHRRYYPKIYRLALLKTNHPDDAADIA